MMTLLNDEHRLGLLRQVGGAFQFRHDLLYEQLAMEHGGSNT